MKKKLPKAQPGAIIKAIGQGFKAVKPAYKALKAEKAAKKLADLKKLNRAEAAKKAAATRATNKAKALEEAAAKSKRGRKPKGSDAPPPSTPGTKNLQEVKVTAKKNSNTKTNTKTKSTSKLSQKDIDLNNARVNRKGKIARRGILGAITLAGTAGYIDEKVRAYKNKKKR